MAAKTINLLDTFAPWIRAIEYRDGQWHARFSTGHRVAAPGMETIVGEMLEHLMHETIRLSCLATDTSYEEMQSACRTQSKSDKRMAIGCVLMDNFRTYLPYRVMASALGWRTHGMMIWATRQRDVKEVQQQIDKIYTRFPVLLPAENNKI